MQNKLLSKNTVFYFGEGKEEEEKEEYVFGSLQDFFTRLLQYIRIVLIILFVHLPKVMIIVMALIFMVDPTVLNSIMLIYFFV